MELWLVGQWIKQLEDRQIWEFQGIFDSIDGAIAACRTRSYFIVPVTLNQEQPEETLPFEHVRYPLAEDA